MTFFKLCKYDLVNGTLKECGKYMLSVLLFLVFCIGFVFTKGKGLETQNFGNLLFFMTAGMEEYVLTPGNVFRFPALWMLLLLLPLYITLYYPFNDLTEYGKNVLVNSKSRYAWWFSKCVWAVASVFLYFALLWSVSILFCLCTQADFSLGVSKELLYRMIPHLRYTVYQTTGDVVSESMLAIQMFIMPPLLVAALSVLQMTVSLFIKPFFSFCINVGVLVLSAYYLHPIMLGNYAMSQRNGLLIENGINVYFGILFSVVVLAVAGIVGAVVFKTYDILKRE